MSNKLRLAVVGLGRVSKSHLPAVKALSEKIELTALVSRDEEKSKNEAKKWEKVKVYTSFEEACEDSNIDAFLLLLPHDLHASYTIKALESGKHVLIEKPMAMNEEEACQMVEVAERNNVTLMVGQSRRFFEPVMDSIKRIRAKEIGKVININALLLAQMHQPATEWWKDKSQIGGFIIPLWGSHILDYIIWAYGELPQTVYTQGYTNNSNWDGEDECSISLKFSDGRMANVLMSFNAGAHPTDEEGLSGKRIWSTQNSIYERYIIGTNGMLHLKDEYELYLNSEKVKEHNSSIYNFTWQLEEFVDSIFENREPLASGREVLDTMKVMDACFESMKENKVIILNENAVGRIGR
ncbi:Gfo/Idh/MocA family protein [Bacillus sp. FSL K6-3431]|uniref:Gfo/Idh/MocA family protein n=1 Tax=Bacillus sp. FSL K6-3431 TaxID=2921500 RepID=UPI0030F4E427